MTNVIVAMPLSRVLIEDRISLYLLAVADSGERKSTCDAIFSPGLRNWESERRQAMAAEIATCEAAGAVHEAKKAGILEAIKHKRRRGQDSHLGGDRRARARHVHPREERHVGVASQVRRPGGKPVLRPRDAERRALETVEDGADAAAGHVDDRDARKARERDDRVPLIGRERDTKGPAPRRETDARQLSAGIRFDPREDDQTIRLAAGDEDFGSVLANRDAFGVGAVHERVARDRIGRRLQARDRVVVGVDRPDPGAVGRDLDGPALEETGTSGMGRAARHERQGPARPACRSRARRSKITA